MVRPGSILVLCACAAASCRGGDVPPVTTATDSAGVRIVEHPAELPLASWRTSAEPEAVIGGATREDPAHQFTDVRGAVRLSDGRIVVADWGTKEVRYFDRHGAHLGTIGGGGEGPGEIRFLFSVDRVDGDTVVVGAWPIGTRHWFDERGRFVRSDAFGPWFPGLLGRTLVDGSMLIDTYANGSYGNTIETWAARGPQDELRPVGVVELVSREGLVVDTMGAIAGPTRRKSGRYPESFAAHPLPFSPEVLVAWSRDRVFLGATDRAEVRVLDFGGALRTIVRWTSEPVGVTAADREAFEAEVLDGLRNPERAPHFRRWLSEIDFPEVKPVFAAIIADAEGHLWVRDHARSGEPEVDWTVFGPDGVALARLRMAADLDVLHVDATHVVSLRAGALDVPAVLVHRVER